MTDVKQICNAISDELINNIEIHGGGIDEFDRDVNTPTSNCRAEELAQTPTKEEVDVIEVEKACDNIKESESVICSEERKIEENVEEMDNNIEIIEITCDDIIEENATTVVCAPIEADNSNEQELEQGLAEKSRITEIKKLCCQLLSLEKLPLRKVDGDQLSIEGLIGELGVTQTFPSLPIIEGEELVSLNVLSITDAIVDYGCSSLDLGLLKNNRAFSRKANKLFVLGAGDVSRYFDKGLDCGVKCDYITAHAYLQLYAVGVKVDCPYVILCDRMALVGGYQA